jgi:hypothetical protein
VKSSIALTTGAAKDEDDNGERRGRPYVVGALSLLFIRSDRFPIRDGSALRAAQQAADLRQPEQTVPARRT